MVYLHSRIYIRISLHKYNFSIVNNNQKSRKAHEIR